MALKHVSDMRGCLRDARLGQGRAIPPSQVRKHREACNASYTTARQEASLRDVDGRAAMREGLGPRYCGMVAGDFCPRGRT